MSDENEEYERPDTPEALLDDTLSRHVEDKIMRKVCIERDKLDEELVCLSCLGDLKKKSAIQFCESCRWDGRDRVYVLCEEILRSVGLD